MTDGIQLYRDATEADIRLSAARATVAAYDKARKDVREWAGRSFANGHDADAADLRAYAAELDDAYAEAHQTLRRECEARAAISRREAGMRP